MQTDIEVIKDIPGYKVILKAVLKSQIQQLVEQLADQTGEESVILTASVSDGSLSHLGSESGKVFLQNHDDIKTQFLGFCLKRHHKLLEVEKTNEETTSFRGKKRNAVNAPSRIPAQTKRKRIPLNIQQSQEQISHSKSPSSSFPISLSTHQESSPAVKSQNYKKVSRVTASETVSELHSNVPHDFIKTEAADDKNGHSETATQHTSFSNYSELQDTGTEIQRDSNVAAHDQNYSELKSGSNLPGADREGVESGLEANLNENTGSFELDTGISVKVEAVPESELDLEITGIEPGPLAQSEGSWGQSIVGGPGADQSYAEQEGFRGESHQDQNNHLSGTHFSRISYNNSAAVRNKTDSKKSHTPIVIDTLSVPKFVCGDCGKAFLYRSKYESHLTKHTGFKGFVCETCGKAFIQKRSLVRHHLAMRH